MNLVKYESPEPNYSSSCLSTNRAILLDFTNVSSYLSQCKQKLTASFQPILKTVGHRCIGIKRRSWKFSDSQTLAAASSLCHIKAILSYLSSWILVKAAYGPQMLVKCTLCHTLNICDIGQYRMHKSNKFSLCKSWKTPLPWRPAAWIKLEEMNWRIKSGALRMRVVQKQKKKKSRI